MRGEPGHNTQPHTRLPPSFLDIDAWMTSQMNVALFRKLHGSLMCLPYFWKYYSCVFVQRGTGRCVDVRSVRIVVRHFSRVVWQKNSGFALLMLCTSELMNFPVSTHSHLECTHGPTTFNFQVPPVGTDIHRFENAKNSLCNSLRNQSHCYVVGKSTAMAHKAEFFVCSIPFLTRQYSTIWYRTSIGVLWIMRM